MRTRTKSAATEAKDVNARALMSLRMERGSITMPLQRMMERARDAPVTSMPKISGTTSPMMTMYATMAPKARRNMNTVMATYPRLPKTATRGGNALE